MGLQRADEIFSESRQKVHAAAGIHRDRRRLASASANRSTWKSGGGGGGTPVPGGVSGGGGDFANFAPVGASNVQSLGDLKSEIVNFLKLQFIGDDDGFEIFFC